MSCLLALVRDRVCRSRSASEWIFTHVTRAGVIRSGGYGFHNIDLYVRRAP
jgi:hypothetical protein